ncbi:MAG: Light-repressed protein A [bacterium ADurb.Bin363]|nr:MAG: Light-repressed protein A [bacterium ADurb.Bin363]
MQLIYKGRKFPVTEALKSYTEKRFQKLERHFDYIRSIEIIFDTEGNQYVAKVLIDADGNIVRGEERNIDLYASIDGVVDDLVRQLKKFKEKMSRKRQSSNDVSTVSPAEEIEEEEEETKPVVGKIVKTNRFAMKPMSDEEAAMQLELLKYNFFVYLNAQKEQVHVIYKRKDGNYGLVEPEF